ncbi:Transposase, Mutator family [Streptomyces yunnanensis]|uniref:Mutator family transposase n=1 Tax=Streptomyces yunnanensis TaxID=156453 RepID=A0A9X8R025_9ACTN|nr:Transposase, Mutator family [Streptomyces yunnanensis]
MTTAAGTVEARAPRVNDKRVDEATGERKRFSSAILPPWARKSPKISEVLLLYLHGLSSGDFVPAPEQFLGPSAGLSPATVTRLTAQWQADHKAFGERDLSATDYAYVWADGIHLRTRLEEAKAAVLVVMGVRADGTKELVAMADGYRESSESWAGPLRDCRRRGMRTPVLAIGDGALGFWNAINEVFPETRHQRCWVHKTANWACCEFACSCGAWKSPGPLGRVARPACYPAAIQALCCRESGAVRNMVSRLRVMAASSDSSWTAFKPRRAKRRNPVMSLSQALGVSAIGPRRQ